MCHVLIIEDEFLIALDLQDLFEGEGATSVTIATSQAGAIAAARLQRPDIISSDFTLQSGTGLAAVEAILDEHGDVPVMFITATPSADVAWPPAALVFGKPMLHIRIAEAFRDMKPLLLR